ncbi:hypothetical protein WAF17_02295 [Bernardetia sp. ABR2-2B]|uniref:hypothetical protein n=1 Tax=Bernardetia sp. ABR2-2B TaxID=3127472 RepID=UPI0030D435BB
MSDFKPQTSDFKEMYNKLVLENAKLVEQNRELKYQADLKDYAMEKVALVEIEVEETAKQRNAYRHKAHKLEYEVSNLRTELEFVKKKYEASK